MFARGPLGPFAASATNLAAYIALRRLDLTALQSRLATLGLSSLGRCEAHVRESLDAEIDALHDAPTALTRRRLGVIAKIETAQEDRLVRAVAVVRRDPARTVRGLIRLRLRARLRSAGTGSSTP